jgi:FkbM family methyltransferase
MTDHLVREARLPGTASRMLAAWVGRYLARRDRAHLQQGMPQLALFAFDHVGRAVNLWGRYERDELDLLMQALAPRGAGRGQCLDIGANIGNHALFFAEHFAAVLAFEPNPRTFALLQLNAALRPNVRCLNIGLSDAAGQATLAVPADNVGMATLQPGAPGQAVACELRRLDDLPQAAAQRVTLIKIDVEGHEAAVLRGGAALLQRDRPVVVFEQTPQDIDAQGNSAALQLLRDAGYRRVWTLQAPHMGRWRALNLLRRLLLGDRLRLVECQRLERRFHSMVVALPD